MLKIINKSKTTHRGDEQMYLNYFKSNDDLYKFYFIKFDLIFLYILHFKIINNKILIFDKNYTPSKIVFY